VDFLTEQIRTHVPEEDRAYIVPLLRVILSQALADAGAPKQGVPSEMHVALPTLVHFCMAQLDELSPRQVAPTPQKPIRYS
jgi:hypothetical protein